MANINVKLKNASGDVLYPKTLWSNIEGKPSFFPTRWSIITDNPIQAGHGEGGADLEVSLNRPAWGSIYVVIYYDGRDEGTLTVGTVLTDYTLPEVNGTAHIQWTTEKDGKSQVSVWVNGTQVVNNRLDNNNTLDIIGSWNISSFSYSYGMSGI